MTESQRSMLTVYDLKNKMICFNSELESPVVHMIYEWDNLHVLLKDQNQR